MPNRHNAMSVLMTGIGNIQKALDTGAVLQKMHSYDLETAVPHHGQDQLAKAEPDSQIDRLCCELLYNGSFCTTFIGRIVADIATAGQVSVYDALAM